MWTSLGLQYFVTTVAAATATATVTATSLCSSLIRLAVRLATAATASDGQQVSSLSPGQALATSAMPVTATAATTTTGMATSPARPVLDEKTSSQENLLLGFLFDKFVTQFLSP